MQQVGGVGWWAVGYFMGVAGRTARVRARCSGRGIRIVCGRVFVALRCVACIALCMLASLFISATSQAAVCVFVCCCVRGEPVKTSKNAARSAAEG